MEEEQHIITGATEQEVWDKISAELATEEDILTYDTIISYGGRNIELYIDIDLGGGFEGGSELTQFSALLNVNQNFRFAMHDEDFLDSIGKFFGLEDVKLGYPELDDRLVIKTNTPEKVVSLFADPELRSVFTGLEDFDFGIHTHTPDDTDEERTFLELNIDQGITDPLLLQRIYRAFYAVLVGLEA
jgi:hypothetical protein